MGRAFDIIKSEKRTRQLFSQFTFFHTSIEAWKISADEFNSQAFFFEPLRSGCQGLERQTPNHCHLKLCLEREKRGEKKISFSFLPGGISQSQVLLIKETKSIQTKVKLCKTFSRYSPHFWNNSRLCITGIFLRKKPHVITNLYDYFYSMEHKRRNFKEF